MLVVIAEEKVSNVEEVVKIKEGVVRDEWEVVEAEKVEVGSKAVEAEKVLDDEE